MNDSHICEDDIAIDLSGVPTSISDCNVMEGYVEPQSPEEIETNSQLESEDSLEGLPVKRKPFVIGPHIKVSGDSPPIYMCTICNCKFKMMRQARYHDYCATGKRPLKCKLCGKRFVKHFHLVYHIRTHTGEAPFKCSFCDKRFKQRDKVKRHEIIHKGRGEKDRAFACTVCQKTLSGKQALNNHMLIHSSTKPFRCKFCKKRYANENYFKIHLKKHTSSANFVCEVCGKCFKSSSSLNCHILAHSGERPYKCDKCGSSFKSKHTLERHDVKHRGEADFECLVCSATFGRKDNMVRHIKNNHPGEAGGMPKCKKNKMSAKKSSGNHNISEQTITSRPSKSLEISSNIPFIHNSVIKHTNNVTKTLQNEQLMREPVIKLAPHCVN